jgi:proline dehydrogenase
MSSDLVKAQAAEAERIAFPGIPLPARLDALQRGTVPQGSALTPEDVHALIELRDDVFAICERAEQRGVKIIMDAEYRYC